MLSVLAIEHGGITPDDGDILVAGANGGVGSIAIALLSRLGYRVVASTGRLEESDHLHQLGAAEIINRAELSGEGSPLGPERWAGAIDSVGSHTLANVLAQTRYRGVVTACGLVQCVDLPVTVLPFILRNVTLAGIDSVNAPKAGSHRRITLADLLAYRDDSRRDRTKLVESFTHLDPVVRRAVTGDQFAQQLLADQRDGIDAVIDALVAKRTRCPITRIELVDQLAVGFPGLAAELHRRAQCPDRRLPMAVHP